MSTVRLLLLVVTVELVVLGVVEAVTVTELEPLVKPLAAAVTVVMPAVFKVALKALLPLDKAAASGMVAWESSLVKVTVLLAKPPRLLLASTA